MGALNTEGIFEYDGTELGAPGASFMNLLADSVTDTVTDIRADIAGLDILTDSNWTGLTTLGSGWTATSGHAPRIRRVGDRVDIFGAVTRTSTTGSVSDLLTIPVGYRPAGAYINTFVGTVVSSGGQVVQLLVSGSSHLLSIPPGYSSATLGSGVVVPLLGSWYVN